MSEAKTPTTTDTTPSSAELQKLVAEYETRIDEIAELVSRVRHELNNPLTGVLGQVQLLLREELSDKVRHRAETIEQLALRLTTIVAELREVQRAPRAAEELAKGSQP